MRLRFNFSSFETEIYLQSKQKLKKNPKNTTNQKTPKFLLWVVISCSAVMKIGAAGEREEVQEQVTQMLFIRRTAPDRDFLLEELQFLRN